MENDFDLNYTPKNFGISKTLFLIIALIAQTALTETNTITFTIQKVDT